MLEDDAQCYSKNYLMTVIIRVLFALEVFIFQFFPSLFVKSRLSHLMGFIFDFPLVYELICDSYSYFDLKGSKYSFSYTSLLLGLQLAAYLCLDFVSSILWGEMSLLGIRRVMMFLLMMPYQSILLLKFECTLNFGLFMLLNCVWLFIKYSS